MGILLNLTKEYFKEIKREEEKTDFDKYIDKVEWVDMGHPEYLFAKEDFLIDKNYFKYNNFIREFDMFNCFDALEIKKNIETNYKKTNFITKDIFKWLLKNNDYELESFKNFVNVVFYNKIKVTNPSTNSTIYFYLNSLTGVTNYISDCYVSDGTVYCNTFSFSPDENKKWTNKISEKTHDGKNEKYRFYLFKLIKEK